MSGENLLKTYPNAAKVVKEWFMNQMIASMESDNITPDEFKQAMIDEGISDERLGTLIDIQPRTFWELFDENEIFIFSHYMDVKSNVGFFHTIKDIDNNPVTLFKTRKESENYIISGAFSALEEQITGNLNFEQLNKEEENEIK